MTALLHTAQASVRAMIFDFGREVGVYSALRLELRTVWSRADMSREIQQKEGRHTEEVVVGCEAAAVGV